MNVANGDRLKLIQRVVRLSWFTIIYNIVEGVVSMTFGIEEASVALFGFGVDSFIEAFSALIVLWRFKGEAKINEGLSKEKELRASSLIGGLFLFLAALTGVAATIQLWEGKHPQTTLPGAIISLLSLSFMFYLWKQKKMLGQELGSSTVLNDAACSLACIKLSGVLLLGSILFYVAPSLWWADATAAIVMSYFIFKEGHEIRENAKKGATGCCACE